MITRLIKNSSLAIIFYCATSAAIGATELNSRVTATVDSQGQLTIKSGYLTNYLMRGVDRNGETGTFYLLNRNQKALDFDMADIEFDGFLPSVDFKLPTFNTESTTIDLAEYNYPNKQGTAYWRNTDFVIKGASLVDLAVNFPSNTEDRIDVTGLFLLNTLTVIDTVTNTVTVSDESKFASAFKKLNILSNEINNYKKTLEKAATILAFADLFVAQIDAFVDAANISDSELEDYESLTDKLFWYKQLSHNIKLLNNVVSTKTQDNEIAKDILSKEYLVVLKDVAQGSAETILDTTVDTFAQQYGSAANKNDKILLVNKYVVSPLASTMIAYRNYLNDELTALEASTSPDKSKITAKKEQIRFLRNSNAIIQLAKLLFATDDIATIAKNEPEKIVPVLIEVAAIVKDEVFTLDNTKYVIDKTMGEAATKALYAKAGKAVPYMKAIQVGEGVGNRLIPLLWDLVLGENNISTSIVDGEISSFGYPQTDVTIVKNGSDYQHFNNVTDRLTQYIAADKGEVIQIGANMYRPQLFDKTRAPWYLNISHVPTLVYKAIVITPTLTTQTAFCVKKMLGNIDYVTQKHIDARYIIDAKECGVGTLRGGHGAFDDKDSEYHPQTHYNDNELSDALKLATQEHTFVNAIDSINYQVTGDDDQVIYVRFSGLQHNDIAHEFHIVPTQGTDDISLDTTSIAANNLTLQVNIVLSQDNPNDPIAEILINWGDGSIQSSITGSQFTHTYAQVGQFQPTIKVIRQSGQISSQDFPVNLQEIIDQAAPTVSAGADQEVTAGETVTLTATATKTTGTFLWEKVTGKAIVVDDYTAQSISFVAPQTEEQTKLLFRLTVEGVDGSQKTDAVKVTVNPAVVANVAPTVDAGIDQHTTAGATVTLTASAQDSDGIVERYQWQQTAGITVNLNNTDKNISTFVAPLVSQTQTLSFAVTATDNDGASTSDTLNVDIVPNATSFTLPCQECGYPGPYDREWHGDSTNHLAKDYPAFVGDNVLAISRGQVVKILTNSTGFGGSNPSQPGGAIVMLHTKANGNNFFALYGHVNATAGLNVDDVVEKGQVIGTVGNYFVGTDSGVQNWSHLHFGIWDAQDNFPTSQLGYGEDRSFVNPELFLNTTLPATIYGEVTAISPSRVQAGQEVTFTLTGTNLPSTIAMSLSGAKSCAAPFNLSTTSASITCITGEGVGDRPFYVKNKPQGLFLKGTQSLTITVEQAVVNEREVLGVIFTDLAFAQCVQAQVTAKGVSALGELTTLNCSGKGITDVSELSHLTGLVTLGLDNNAITTINLDANQALKLAGLRNNPLTQATKDYLATISWIAKLYYENEPPVAASGKLNDTGITTCSNNSENDLSCPVAGFEGQDGEHGRDVTHNDDSDGHAGFSFTKIDANGNELAPDASQWSCVKDNVTGYIWEVKTDDGGLRDNDNTYTWYNSTGSNDGGSAGTPDGGNCPSAGQCDTEKYVANINAQSLCGYSDWRLPAREVLRSIVDYSRVSPAIDTAYFINTRSSYYWSSSPIASSSHGAWYVNVYNGGDSTSSRNGHRRVRLVRGGQ